MCVEVWVLNSIVLDKWGGIGRLLMQLWTMVGGRTGESRYRSKPPVSAIFRRGPTSSLMHLIYTSNSAAMIQAPKYTLLIGSDMKGGSMNRLTWDPVSSVRYSTMERR